MARSALEVADIFRDHGSAWRDANRGHVSLGQLKVMSAIESCRTAALGGHVARCEDAACGHTIIAYNSCRNRHCPKCQGSAAREWLAEREAELLGRVGEDVTTLTPHRTGCADFPLPVLHGRGSLAPVMTPSATRPSRNTQVFIARLAIRCRFVDRLVEPRVS